MCSIAAAGLIIALGSTAIAYYEQDENVKAQNKITRQTAAEGAELAAESFRQQAKQVRQKDQQSAIAATQELTQSAKQAAEARATARVSAGEAGASGVSVDNLIADYYRQEAGYKNSVETNLAWEQSQSNMELEGIRSNSISQVVASRRPMVNRPSYLAAGLTGAGQSLDAYNRYRYTSSTSTGRTTG